jgi:hypothetical protein
MEEFARTLAAINECTDVSDPPAFQVIQLFKTLPDFLMFPVFLALRHQHRSIPALPESLLPDREIIHALPTLLSTPVTIGPYIFHMLPTHGMIYSTVYSRLFGMIILPPGWKWSGV